MRYRYYVSQAVLQNRNEEAGSIARVAAPDIEDLVIVAVRHQVGDVNREADRPSPRPIAGADQELVCIARVEMKMQACR